MLPVHSANPALSRDVTIAFVIIVVEGPSAAGNTTWSTEHGVRNIVPEAGHVDPPDNMTDDVHGEFWTNANCELWAESITIEAERGVAVCDTDPLKLHYDYCLARVGATTWRRFDVSVKFALDAVSLRRLGIADPVLISVPNDEILTRQRNADLTRSRRNFELHRQTGHKRARLVRHS
jgi:hypothetical protein